MLNMGTINPTMEPKAASRFEIMNDANHRLMDMIVELKTENMRLKEELDSLYKESEAFYNAVKNTINK